jgi:hypothetical protein
MPAAAVRSTAYSSVTDILLVTLELPRRRAVQVLIGEALISCDGRVIM